MSPEELKAILDDHAKWLQRDGGTQADLRWVDLSGANLSRANLSRANLSAANLSAVNLSRANLSEANLSGANLRWANLSEANLSRANLSEASLRVANLSEANLSRANLSEASLRVADLRGANLSRANLSEANLCEAKVDVAICRMDFGGWSICVYADKTSIGCEQHPNECWLAWEPDSDEIKRMHSDASSWWETHGEVVKAAIRCVMAKTKGGEA